jgi:hypothetical protein
MKGINDGARETDEDKIWRAMVFMWFQLVHKMQIELGFSKIRVS